MGVPPSNQDPCGPRFSWLCLFLFHTFSLHACMLAREGPVDESKLSLHCFLLCPFVLSLSDARTRRQGKGRGVKCSMTRSRLHKTLFSASLVHLTSGPMTDKKKLKKLMLDGRPLAGAAMTRRHQWSYSRRQATELPPDSCVL